jgi:hypothetical protein
MKASTLPKVAQQQATSSLEISDKIKGDYESRKMNSCLFCGEKYNVGERIPRILVHCGHTFCTECLS